MSHILAHIPSGCDRDERTVGRAEAHRAEAAARHEGRSQHMRKKIGGLYHRGVELIEWVYRGGFMGEFIEGALSMPNT